MLRAKVVEGGRVKNGMTAPRSQRQRQGYNCQGRTDNDGIARDGTAEGECVGINIFLFGE